MAYILKGIGTGAIVGAIMGSVCHLQQIYGDPDKYNFGSDRNSLTKEIAALYEDAGAVIETLSQLKPICIVTNARSESTYATILDLTNEFITIYINLVSTSDETKFPKVTELKLHRCLQAIAKQTRLLNKIYKDLSPNTIDYGDEVQSFIQACDDLLFNVMQNSNLMQY